MIRRSVLVALLSIALFSVLLFPHTVLAWGGQGHRLVALLAEPGLTPATRRQIDLLLAGEPDPTLPGIASWADELREHDPGLGKRSARWHYVNLADHDCGYEPPRDCRNGDCVIEALAAQTAILHDRSQPLAARRQALKFVVHLVGDIHQPMHAGYAHDRGGNDYQVQFDGQGSNLHALWDSGMFKALHLSDAEYLQRLQTRDVAAAPAYAVLPPPAPGWAQASCRIAVQPGVYPSGHTPGPAYADSYRPLAERQLQLAGTRLAEVLNAALGR